MTESPLSHWNRLVRREPRRTVLRECETDSAHTIADLDRRAEAFRKTIGSVASGQTVAFQLPNGADWLACFLAILKNSCIAMPLDPGGTEAYARDLADRAGAELLIRQTGESTGVATLPRPRKRTTDLCLAKATSGSTGRPKTCFFRHGEILADGRNVIATMGIRPSDTNLGHIPFGHSYGIGNLVMPLILQGTRLVATNDPVPRSLWRAMIRHRVTVLPTVPGILKACNALDLERPTELRLVISAGARLPPDTAREFRERYGVRVHNFLGSTETGAIAYDRTGDFSESGEAVGTAAEGVSLSVSPTGRLLVAGRAVVTRNNPRRREGRGAFLLSDRAKIGPGGELHLRGRTGKTIKIGGRRVDLGHFEQLCLRHPSIKECVAAPIRDERHFGALFVVETDSFDPGPWLRRELPPWMIPRYWKVVETLPVDRRGKLTAEAIRKSLRGGVVSQ